MKVRRVLYLSFYRSVQGLRFYKEIIAAALTALFNGLKNQNTPVIVERIVTDIDNIVRIVRFDGWQNTTAGKLEVKKALRSVVWIKR